MRSSKTRSFGHALLLGAAVPLALACTGEVMDPGSSSSPGSSPGVGGPGMMPGSSNGAGNGGPGMVPPNGGPAQPPPPPPVEIKPGSCGYLPIRAYRLSPLQLRRSYAALLGTAAPGDDLESALSSSLPTDLKPFSNAETVLSVSPGFSESLFNSLKAAATSAVANLNALHSCFAQGVTKPCVTTFINEFGAKAWRRPWTTEEVNSYVMFYDDIVAKSSDPKKGVEFVLRRMLAAPDALFRFEIGGMPNAQGIATLNSYEMASALSYTILDAPPDAMLMAAAKAGQLVTKVDIEAQVKRLLSKPETAPNVVSFFNEYLEGGSLTAIPEQIEELKRFVSHALWTDAGKFSTLMSANYTFVNPVLQKHYGWTTPAVRDWQMFTPPAAEGRAGLLTLGAFLSRKTNRSARGKFIRYAYLCSFVPDPPAEADQNLDGQKAKLAAQLGRPPTEDEARQAHMSDPKCSVCHVQIDSIGEPYLAFDRLGVWKATNSETNKPYPTAANIINTNAIDGPVADQKELSKKLAESPTAHQCFTRHLYEYVIGREAADTDSCHIDVLTKTFSANGGDMKQLFIDAVASDAFRLRLVAKK